MVNILYLVPSIFMLQVYDRVVPTRGGTTLLLLTLILVLALVVFAILDAVRMRLLLRASMRLERQAAPGILRLQLPLRMPGLGHVNCYALEDERGWT